MQKVYERINWENYPSTDTPLNETNLNTVDYAVDTIDDRVIALDITKTNQSDFLQSVHSVTFDNATGVLTVTYENGTVYTVDTKIEKIAINFEYDDDPTSPHYQQLVITLDDGTKQYIDLSALITQYEFDNSTDIAFTVTNGRVSANIVDGSVTRAKIDPDYLAQIDASVNQAHAYETASHTHELDSQAWANGQKGSTDVPSTDPQYENNSLWYAKMSEGFANGQKDGVDVTSESPYFHNNSKYWSEQSKDSADHCDDVYDQVEAMVQQVTFTVDLATGEIMYSSDATYNFSINNTTGNLEWEVVV